MAICYRCGEPVKPSAYAWLRWVAAKYITDPGRNHVWACDECIEQMDKFHLLNDGNLVADRRKAGSCTT